MIAVTRNHLLGLELPRFPASPLPR
jgi:hypothetical protein